jgi:hypothetical protein
VRYFLSPVWPICWAGHLYFPLKILRLLEPNLPPLLPNELTAKDLELSVGMKLARVNLRGIKSALSDMQWLEKYSVSRNWITGTIKVAVVEKKQALPKRPHRMG